MRGPQDNDQEILCGPKSDWDDGLSFGACVGRKSTCDSKAGRDVTGISMGQGEAGAEAEAEGRGREAVDVAICTDWS
jgi:hypothetical protein